jgi:Glycosyltransferase family 87
MTRHARLALDIWAAITALVAASLLVIYLHGGSASLDLFIQPGPLTDLPTALASVTLTWLLVGALLFLLTFEKINPTNVLTFAGFFLIAFLYLNVLRERFRYGDFPYYVEAATNLLNHKPLPSTYFYLPLWATVLQFLVPLGVEPIFLILWLVNIFSLFLFYFLLHGILRKYGFSLRLAAMVTTVFLLVNAPLERTLGYVQVNLLVMNVIFLALLLYPTRPFLSAFSLALAVHLKTSPAVLVLAFLLERDWRWLAWFTFNFIVLALITVAINGISPYLDFLNNVRGLIQAHDAIFRDTSFDSFFRFILPALRINRAWIEIAADLAKAILAIATFYIMAVCVRAQTFYKSAERGAHLLNAVPALFILMTLGSPVVWEHHGLFVTLSFLVMFKRIDSPSAWIGFGFAYLLEFILPTFEFFPWSYGRLLAPLILLWVMWQSGKQKSDAPVFNKLNLWEY